MPIQDVALKANRKRWTIEKAGGRGSGISILMVWHDDDDDDDDYMPLVHRTICAHFICWIRLCILVILCIIWTLTKRMKKKLDGNYARMLWAVLNKSWRQHPTKQQLYGHLPPITKTIQVRRTRYAGDYWRSKDKLRSDIFPGTPSHGWAKVGRAARTHMQRLCADTGCSLEDLPGAMDDRDEWRERVRETRASNAIKW